MNYEIKNFGKTSAFASFLPGIAGVKGTPIWCYYVNRGQGVVSFGVDNKDHAIMEFYPAHMAYQNVKRTGFRTFIRRDAQFFEAFSDENVDNLMTIEMNGLKLQENNAKNSTEIKVSYFILPEEKVGALVRKVEIVNIGDAAKYEVLDGMPNVIPFGVGQDSMKNMTQTAKAWMQVEDHECGLPYYRVRVSMDDSAEVSSIDAGNFAVGFNEKGEKLGIVVDPDAIFGYDLSLGNPVVFATEGIAGVASKHENISNLLPACFFKREATLERGQSVTFYEMVGQVAKKEIFHELVDSINDSHYFVTKEDRAKAIVDELTESVATHTASKEFDAYTKYTYMDNVLRGGYPVEIVDGKVFYVYSRKHGDLERDYNYFSMLPEFYSQGNGNFRDVNQNRRCDTFFSNYVEKENIHTFYSLIQLDGYNPLGIEKKTYTHPEVEDAFTPGSLYAKLDNEQEFNRIMSEADETVNANFGEGYWSDHWTYNLDLVEEYLKIYPEKEEELLFAKEYSYFLSQALINPRAKRYAKTEKGLRQYHYLDQSKARDGKEKLVKVNGEVYRGTLMEKLLLLTTTKFAALDAYGMGVEMEGGKPGWYDALNGLPGMFGSSMAETFELKRMLEYLLAVAKRYGREVVVFKELGQLFMEISDIAEDELKNLEANDLAMSFWNRINDTKEKYRKETYESISGELTSFGCQEFVRRLENFDKALTIGIEKAKRLAGEVIPTYFSFEATDFTEDENGIYPQAFKAVIMPSFLEGSVRYLKLNQEAEEKQKVYKAVKNSGLYDTKLNMYKVNSALETASFEIGRCRAFTPGWLENESIWLHMEYKYLLEVLKSGLYKEFFEDFKNAAIPFLDPEVYGRSILENSSFIVSSSNPNESIHGKGFVARLSGSTIEFISMWQEMMFGKSPFTMEDGKLQFNLCPAIPAYLMNEDGTLTTTFMGNTVVEYHAGSKRDLIPGEYKITNYQYICKDEACGCDCQCTPEDVRDGKVAKILVTIE